MADKTQSQTYNFLIENKSTEDVKKQANIKIKEKRRHGGVTYKLIEINNTNNQSAIDDLSENNRENLEPVISTLINEVKEQETNNDIWTIFKNYLNWSTSNAEELIQAQIKIQELEKEIQQLKKENETLKLKQSNMNFDNFKYNAITIYNEKQRKNTGIEKIHEEILPIGDKVFFITTFVHTNQSISEEIMYFHHFKKDG